MANYAIDCEPGCIIQTSAVNITWWLAGGYLAVAKPKFGMQLYIRVLGIEIVMNAVGVKMMAESIGQSSDCSHDVEVRTPDSGYSSTSSSSR